MAAGLLYSQWWRRLVNAYELKLGMVCLQSKKTVWSIPERFRDEILTMGRYRNLSSFILLHVAYDGGY